MKPLKVGDILEAGPLMGGACESEQIVLQVTQVHKETSPEVIQFLVSFFGVAIGKVTRTTSEDSVKWHWERA